MIVYPTKIDQPSGWFAIHLHPNKLWVENFARFVKHTLIPGEDKHLHPNNPGLSLVIKKVGIVER